MGRASPRASPSQLGRGYRRAGRLRICEKEEGSRGRSPHRVTASSKTGHKLPCTERSNLLPMRRVCGAFQQLRATSADLKMWVIFATNLRRPGEVWPALSQANFAPSERFFPQCSRAKCDAPRFSVQAKFRYATTCRQLPSIRRKFRMCSQCIRTSDAN